MQLQPNWCTGRLRFPKQFLSRQSTVNSDITHFVAKLRSFWWRLIKRIWRTIVCIQGLATADRVFNRLKGLLQPPYDESYAVVNKVYKILRMQGKDITISIDCLKHIHIISDAETKDTVLLKSVNGHNKKEDEGSRETRLPSQMQSKAIQSGRRVRFPDCLQMGIN